MSASGLRRAGRLAWAVLGILAVVAVVGLVVSRLSLVVVPVILALFPATLLVPVHRLLRRWRFPSAAAALTTMLAGIVVFAGVIGGMVALVMAELPEIAESAGEGIGQLRELIERIAPGSDIRGIGDLISAAREQVGEASDVASQALEITVQAVETVAGVLLTVVVLFFYLKDGRGIVESLVQTAPSTWQPRAMSLAEGAWDTLGSYFRGQLLVAAVDAVAIGVALLLLGIPLAVPLAVLVFFGGLFPIVGAVATGSVAVLVALSDGGLVMGLVVAGIVLAVQQLEGNVLEPLILSHVIDLNPLLIVLSITAGAVLLGVLGAFLAVPVAAIVKRTLVDLSEPSSGAISQSTALPDR